MKLTERAEEILEMLWVHTEEKRQESMEVGAARGEPEIEQLCSSGHVKLHDSKIILTQRGKDEGKKIVRRHRLAERLFADILVVKEKFVHPLSCRFEHLLHEGVEADICTLLGHPSTCPHGRMIPQGECCKKSAAGINKVISSLSDLNKNQKGKVAYIHTQDNQKLQKLMAMGILPGIAVTLLQKFPSYVLQTGQSQFAIDKELADCIFVRKTN